MQDLISVVVPIYNVENYLNKCIDSIINQTYKKLEIILVDDGSPDKCGEICDKYIKKDDRIQVFHKKNGGLSDARNYGLNKATGEYIIFIDSDDYIEKNMIKKLYENVKKYKSEISICNFIEETEDGKYLTSKKNYDGKVYVYDKINAIKELINQEKITNHTWNKLYKKSLFKNIKYPVGQLMEDISTTYKLFEKSKNIVFVDIPLYHYIQRGSSILGHITIKRIIDQEKAFFERNKKLLKKYPNLIKELEIDNMMTIKTIHYLAYIGKYSELYNSSKYKNYYEVGKKLFRKYKSEINSSFTLKLFYLNKNLYRLLLLLKGRK